MGRLSGRPVLVFSEFPGCPFCIEMEATSFRNAEVLELVADVVPIKLDLSKMPESEWRWYWERYPYFGVQDVEGNELYTFPGMHHEDSLRRHLALGVEKAAEIGPRLSWERVRTLSATFDSALAAETDGRLEVIDRLRIRGRVLWRNPGVRRRRAGHVEHESWSDRTGDYTTDKGHHAGSYLRPSLRYGPDQ